MDLHVSTPTRGLAVGLAAGFFLGASSLYLWCYTTGRNVRRQTADPPPSFLATGDTGDSASQPVMALLVRTDLKLTRGRACVQCGHAVHRLYRRIKKAKDFSPVVKAWRDLPCDMRKWRRLVPKHPAGIYDLAFPWGMPSCKICAHADKANSPKMCLAVPDCDALMRITSRAQAIGVPTMLVSLVGSEYGPQGTTAVAALGPTDRATMKELTQGLLLY